MSFSFAPPRRRRPMQEPIVPIINVVFLLLIFFLISAQFTPPAPFEIETARAATDPQEVQAAGRLWIDDLGDLGFDGQTGNDVWAALAMHQGPLEIRADARLAGTTLAGLLGRLDALGLTDIVLITRPDP